MELAAASYQEARRIHETVFANIRFRRISSTYNCFGLVFANRRTNVDPDRWDLIRTEDGYRRIQQEAEVRIGDIVIYKKDAGEIEHVGIVIDFEMTEDASRRFLILSKWGPYGEYIHALRDVPPQFGRIIEFWSEREP